MQGQIFKDKDTLRYLPTIECGVGTGAGSNYYEPTNDGFVFNNKSGYDNSLFIRLKANIYKGLALCVDYRYAKQSGTINLMNNVITNYFYLESSGSKIPIMLQYSFRTKGKKEIISIHGAYAFNTSLFETSSDYFQSIDQYYATAIGAELLNGQKTKWNSIILGISKSLDIISILNLTVFFEAEQALNEIDLKNGYTNRATMNYESHSSSYKSNSFRLGILIGIGQ